MNDAYYRRHLIHKTQCCLPKAINVVLLPPTESRRQMEFHLKESLHTFRIDPDSSYSSNDDPMMEKSIYPAMRWSQMHLFKDSGV